MIPRCTVGKGITGAAQYILSEGRDPETGKRRRRPANGNSRVAWIGGTGFGFDIVSREDADLARRIMEFDALNQASRTRQCEKDCVHLSLGWRPGETPTREEMEAAAREALKAMGMENAKALFVGHNDEAYAHLHIVASKINPATGRAYDLKENFLKLSRWAEAYEREHGGVICSRREEANELREAIDKRDASTILELMTRQRATFTARDLDRALRKQSKDDFERGQFAARIFRHVEIVALSDEADGAVTRYTTRTVLEAEGHVLRAAQGLDRNRGHRLSDAACGAVLGSDRFSTVTREQARAVRLATEAGGLALIDGQAGTGKSYTMAAIREAYEVHGCRVVGLAPTNAVAQDMLGDGFRHARTIHSELFALNNGRTTWSRRTVVMVDEAAMVDTKLMAILVAHAYDSGVKLILVGDDRQLSSIDRGGMFSALKDRYGAASLTEVRRQLKKDDRRATEMMAEGNFHDALAGYAARGQIHWAGTPEGARAALVRRWEADSAADPGKTRFVFAYTNVDVDELNRDLRRVRQARGELGVSTSFETKHGKHDFAEGDRVQFTGTDKTLNIYNGNAGVIRSIDGSRIVVCLDGKDGPLLAFDAAVFRDFRHGYAGTIYKGQGRTIDQTYLYHSAHWRRAASYVALSRHREKAELFVARQTAGDLKELARQMARRDERRAASQFFHGGEPAGPVRPLTPIELLARLAGRSRERRHRHDRIRSEFVKTAQEELEHQKPVDQGRSAIKEKEKEKGKSRGGDLPPKTNRKSRPYRQMMAEPHRRTSPKDAAPDDRSASRDVAKVFGRVDLLALWRRVAAWITQLRRPTPPRPGYRRRNHRLLR
jgi:Ti-type conjugative transfer relaxase TraA